MFKWVLSLACLFYLSAYGSVCFASSDAIADHSAVYGKVETRQFLSLELDGKLVAKVKPPFDGLVNMLLLEGSLLEGGLEAMAKGGSYIVEDQSSALESFDPYHTIRGAHFDPFLLRLKHPNAETMLFSDGVIGEEHLQVMLGELSLVYVHKSHIQNLARFVCLAKERRRKLFIHRDAFLLPKDKEIDWVSLFILTEYPADGSDFDADQASSASLAADERLDFILCRNLSAEIEPACDSDEFKSIDEANESWSDHGKAEDNMFHLSDATQMQELDINGEPVWNDSKNIYHMPKNRMTLKKSFGYWPLRVPAKVSLRIKGREFSYGLAKDEYDYLQHILDAEEVESIYVQRVALERKLSGYLGIHSKLIIRRELPTLYRNVCSICWENRCDVRLKPCGHEDICFSCADANPNRSCHLCREKISEITLL